MYENRRNAEGRQYRTIALLKYKVKHDKENIKQNVLNETGMADSRVLFSNLYKVH